MKRLETKKAQQIAVPLTKDERILLDDYLFDTGLLKGRFVRQAIIEKLEREGKKVPSR